jgi:hypothetical protein
MPNFGTIDDITGTGGDLSSSLLDQIASRSVDKVADLPSSSTDGDVKYVKDTQVYYIYNAAQNEWESLGTNLTDANLKFLRKDENLNDIPDKALARQNLGIDALVDAYTKTETDTLLDDKANVADVYSKTDADTLLANKIDKIAGKSLSENDFTNDYKTQVDNNTTARHTHSNKALLDTYTQTEVNLADAVSKKHEHSNKTILDNTTASYTTSEQTKLAGIQAGAEVNVNADWNATSGDAQILNKPSIYTQTEVDNFLSTNSSNDRNRANHTGTQAPSTIVQDTNNRFVSDAEKSTWNAKENSITAGTTSQYYRGDKTFQTLNTTVVAEGTNQYFTNARAIASVLTGFVASATRTAIASTDSILSAFQKCQKYFNDLTTIAFSGSGADLTNNTVTNSKLAQMSANTIKGNNTGATANSLDLTVAQTKTMLALDQVNNTTDASKPISTATQTALDNKVDFNNAQTLTPTQVRQNARNIDTIPYFTTTQRDGLTGWVANEMIFNTTTNRYEKRNSGNSAWEAMLFGVPVYNDASKILRSTYYNNTTPSSAGAEASIDVNPIITRNNVLGWLGFVDDGSSDGYNLPSGGASTHVNKTINAHLQLVNGSSPLKLWIEAPSNTLLISKAFRVVIWHFETVS